MFRNAKRQAFGLVELFVVLAIVALLAGLLLPAVQGLRQTAAQQASMKNLMQCGLAVHSYHDNHKKMPDAFGRDAKRNAERTLWFALLPFVESNEIFRNDVADTAMVPAYAAPDDGEILKPDGRLNFSANIRVFGYQTYTGSACNDVGKAMKVKDAKTPIVSGLRLGTLLDGTSNTIAMSTRMSSCNRTDKGEPIRTKINGDPGTPQGGFFGASEVSNGPSPLFAATPTTMYQITPKDFDDLPVGQSKRCINNPSSVPHSLSGARLAVALCDGSCRYIRTELTPVTFGQALSPGDRKPMAEEWNND